MAQDGNWQVKQERLREVAEKLGKLDETRARRYEREDEREAKVRRQHSLEQAAGIVKSAMDDVTSSRVAGRAALELADQFYRWVETGQLPAA